MCEFAVGIALLEEFGAPLAHLLDEVAQALDLLAVGHAHAAAQQTPQRVVQVAPRQEVVGQPGEQLVGVEADELLGAVPAPVVVAGAHRR